MLGSMLVISIDTIGGGAIFPCCGPMFIGCCICAWVAIFNCSSPAAEDMAWEPAGRLPMFAMGALDSWVGVLDWLPLSLAICGASSRRQVCSRELVCLPLLPP